MPFGEYEDFEHCVRENMDKDDPKAYCAEIKRKIEGKGKISRKSLAKAWKACKSINKANIPKFDFSQGDSSKFHDQHRRDGIIANDCRTCERYTQRFKGEQKSGVAQMPADITKKIDGNDTNMKSKKKALAKAYKSLKATELEAGTKVEMEHTDDPKVAQKIAMDHLKEDPHYYTKLIAVEGKAPEVKKLARHQIAMHNFSFVEAKFLKPGKYTATDGNKYNYGWDVLQRDKDTFKGKTFYIAHEKEKPAMEYGIIDDVYAKTIDGVNWLVAKIKIPELDITQGLLSRIETGLTKYVSTTHNLMIEKGTNNVRKMTGLSMTAVNAPEVPEAGFIDVHRNLKA